MRTGLRSVLAPSVTLAQHYGFGAFSFLSMCTLLSCLALTDLTGYQNGDSMETALACGRTFLENIHEDRSG